ncbi:MAG: hypothetical protein JRH13_14715, partial [Deltaproteobacteria bacterium]|nr:hypothetical protein [Deltaproteobacteria bacterium]
MRSRRLSQFFIDLLADKRRFASLTVILFLVYTVSFLVFDRLVANEQRY